MGLYKRGRFWWGSYHDPRIKQFVRKSTKTADKEAARAVLRGWERSAADPDSRPKNSTTVRALIVAYRDAKTRSKRSAGTLRGIHLHVRHLARILGDETIVRDISAAAVDRYVHQRQDETAAETTIAKELSTLRGMLKLAHRYEWCDHPDRVMPTDIKATSKPGTRKVETLTDLGKLVDALHDSDRKAHVLYLAATGADWSPSLLARREDIDFARGLVHVRGTKTGSRTREVPIVPLNRAMLERVHEVAPKIGPMFRPWTNVRRDLELACSRAGIPKVTPRDFRRTLGTWLRAQGIEPSLIGDVLGHADGRMAERVYGRLSAEARRDIMLTRLERDAVVRDSREERFSGNLGDSRSTGNTVPGDRIELSTRGFSIGSRATRKAGETVRTVPMRLPNGTRMYVKKVRTFGELIDDALRLGAEG